MVIVESDKIGKGKRIKIGNVIIVGTKDNNNQKTAV
jgi:hypothetical protein